MGWDSYGEAVGSSSARPGADIPKLSPAALVPLSTEEAGPTLRLSVGGGLTKPVPSCEPLSALGALPAYGPEAAAWENAFPQPAGRPSLVTQTLVSLAAPPTNYGLYERLKRRWLTPEAAPRESVYTSSYPRPPLCALSRREHAIPVPPPGLHPAPRF